MTDKTVYVANMAQLDAAIKNATGGEHIEVAAGNYDTLKINKYFDNIHNASNVTIESADSAHQAVFKGISIAGESNLTINDVKVSVPYDGVKELTGVAVSDSSHITITNSSIVGSLVTAAQQGADPTVNEVPVAGAGVGTGVDIRNSDGVNFSNNEVAQFFTGLNFAKNSNTTIDYNNLHGMRNDVMYVVGWNNGEIKGNYFHDQLPVPDSEEHLHRDNIQIGPAYTSDVVLHNLVIDSNIISNTADTYRQSIIVNNVNYKPAVDDMSAASNIIIENNLIYGNHAIGTDLGHVDGATVKNNTYLQTTDQDGVKSPYIQVTMGSKNIIVENNVSMHAVAVDSSASNVVTSNNYTIQRDDQTKDNYVGKLFVDGLGDYHGKFSEGDFTALANSIIAKEHLGSSLTWSPVGMTAPSLYVKVDYGTGLDKQTISYAAATIFKTNVDLTGAKVVLDFGDGTTSTSFTGSHVYTKPGAYVITGTITLADGTRITGSEGVSVHDPKVVDIDFEKGVVDLSAVANTLNPVGTTLVKTALGQSLHLDGSASYLGLGRPYDVASNEALTVSFAFKKDHAGDTGVLFNQFLTTAISLNAAGQLVVTTSDADKHNFTQKDAVSVADTNWHQVTVTFDGAKGEADYYLDGQLIGTQKGFTAGQTDLNREPTIGSAVGSSLAGTYDNVRYLSGALSTAQVAQSWAALQNVLHPASGTAGSSPVTTQPDTDNEAAYQAAMVNAFLAAHPNASTDARNHTVDAHLLHLGSDATGVAVGGSDNLVYANDKGDSIYTSAGHGIFIGGASNDTLNGAPVAFGGAGNDVLRGTDGNDVLYGDAGNDTLIGKGGSDKLYGGDGDDRLVGGDGANNLLDGGAGNDTLGSSGANATLIGGAGNDVLYAGGTHDTLLGGDGNDLLRAWGTGGDYLDGGKGVDQIYASNGNDTIVYDANDSVILGYKGFDTLLVAAGNGDLDFSKIGKFGGIDKVDMENGTKETLTLHYSDILQSDNHALVITGDAGDTVQLAAGVKLTQVPGAVAGSDANQSAGHEFVHYTGTANGARLDLFVDADVHVLQATTASH